MTSCESEEREFALGNSVVLGEIFRHLNTKELLEISLVNKRWNWECRRVLRNMKKCVAVIKGGNLCSRAREFNDMVGKLVVNPFNGLSVTVDGHQCEAAAYVRKMDDVYGNLMKMNIKYFELNWWHCGWRSGTCLLEKYILRFLATSQTLENLHLIQAPPGILLERGDWFKDDARLPRLRSVKLGNQMDLEQKGFEFNRINFLEIAARAPNLEQVQNRLHLDFIGSLPVEKMHIIKNLMLPTVCEWVEGGARMRILWDKVGECELKLDALALFGFAPFGNFTKERYLNGLISIIRSSSESLRMMEPDYRATLDLKTISSRLPPLRNVTKLILKFTTTVDVRMVHEFQLKPLASVFPNVTTVILCCSGNVRSFIAAGSQLFPWTTVTKVEVKCREVGNVNGDVNFAQFGLLFPNACTLEISPESKYFHSLEFQQIWSSWPSLERFRFPGKMKISASANMDARFCGVSWEEAEFLRQKDEEYLKAVHIVPIRPAVNHHKGLNSLEIELETKYTFTDEQLQSPPSGQFLLSKVTALVALRQMPHLDFQIRIRPEHARHLEHLKPFVKVLPSTPE